MMNSNAGYFLILCAGCAVADARAVYPEVRDAICAAGELLPPSEERDQLRTLCQVEATVLQCAEAFEAAAGKDDDGKAKANH